MAERWIDKRLAEIAPRDWIGPALLALAALTIRLVWLHFGPKVIEGEGIYYARVGENLAAGRGLVGLQELGLQLLYPPLYSSLIAAGVRAGLNAELAGRLISLLFGIALPVVAFWYARRYHSTAAGWFAGLVAALHPLLVVLSAAVLTESTYLTLELAAAYFMVDTLALGRRRSALLAGVFLGLAYLLRPEGFVLTFFMLLALLAVNIRRLRAAAARAALLLVAFSVFAIPYMTFLWLQTGQVRFEAKTAIGIMMARAEQMPGGEFYFSIGKDLKETGASNTSDLHELLTTHATARERVEILARQSVHNLPELLQALGGMQFGSPFLIALAALGLFATPWDGARLRTELPLLCVAGLTLITFGTWPFFHDRFLYPLLPALIVWTGLGLDRLRTWARNSVDGLVRLALLRRVFVACVIVAPLALISATAVSGVRGSDDLRQSWMDMQLRDAVPVGRWLGMQARAARIVDTGPTVAFYSHDVLVDFPWCDGPTALRYLALQNVHFVILRESDVRRRPYLPKWWQHPPTEHLELLRSFSGKSGVTRVYRWH